ncbi:pyridoxal-phosphate dependent enzyme [Flavobacterium sp.]|uniref:1-aminocyclopropane-1-carboxylate deaminase/D-cysteine desulfhydrase n=1 Tax=Flavobacterium sp. TaxID=239 RepID=UPI00261061CA|nr:pyridoxal-phosphate dependent enzyme [Flavobacterium sp.]MDD3005311.1 pyridoxal-phosphate dependent enzyme [Flavobacterium sp.]
MIASKVENQLVFSDEETNIEVFIKREDMIHPFVSGNKFRKLKYNLIEAKKQGFKVLLTFGGAFSNHIAAVSAAGRLEGFETIGIIRGEELGDKIPENPTLSFAQQNGMQLEFVSRTQYREKKDEKFIKSLEEKFGQFYLIPEGGTNDLAVQGCMEILTDGDEKFNYIACAVGTGGTISGIIKSSSNFQKVLGFPALKGDFLQNEIRNFVTQSNWEIITGYEFGGYGKITSELIQFMNDFHRSTQILLDPIYTAKMVFGVRDLIKKGYFPHNSRVLLIHTGGIQGIDGVNKILEKNKLPKINRND